MDITYVNHPDATSEWPPIAARAGDLIFVGGQMPVHPVTGIPAETALLQGMPYHGSSIEKQLRYLYGNLDEALKIIGTDLKHILKINSFQTHTEDIDMALRVRRDWFDGENPPPSTLVMTPELPVKGARVLIDLINVAIDAEMPMEGVSISSSPAIAQAKAIGWAVYSQAIKGGGFVFSRGTSPHNAQGPLPETLPEYAFPYRYDQVQFQFRCEMERLKDLLADAGCSLSDVVRVECHMTNMEDISSLDEVWEEYFPIDPPARVIIPVPLVSPPMIIETGLIAVDPRGPYRKKNIQAEGVPAPRSPVSQAVKAGPYLFLSGQMATDGINGLAPEAQGEEGFPFHTSNAKLQAKYILKNVDAICRAAGTSVNSIVRRQVHYVDLRDMPKAESVWLQQLNNKLPPTSSFRTSGPLPIPKCTLQYDLIAYIP